MTLCPITRNIPATIWLKIWKFAEIEKKGFPKIRGGRGCGISYGGGKSDFSVKVNDRPKTTPGVFFGKKVSEGGKSDIFGKIDPGIFNNSVKFR